MQDPDSLHPPHAERERLLVTVRMIRHVATERHYLRVARPSCTNRGLARRGQR